MTRGGWITVAVVFVIAVGLVIVGAVYRQPLLVPDVRMQTPDGASEILSSARMKLGTQGQVATDAVGPGLIAAQFPSPKSTADRDASIDVSIAVTPVLTKVPDVHGDTLDVAVNKLSIELFDVRVVDIFHAERTPGTVVQQSPAAGSRWITGRPVAIAVVVGPDDGTAVAVPKLKGLSSKQAYAKLHEVGLTGAGFLSDPAAVDESIVVKQLPGKGVLVRPGTTVFLLFDQPQ